MILHYELGKELTVLLFVDDTLLPMQVLLKEATHLSTKKRLFMIYILIKKHLMRYLFCLIILTLTSCNKDNNDDQQSYSFVFYPRQCKVLATGLVRLTPGEYDGTTYYDKEDLQNDETCEADYLCLLLSTSNIDTLPEGADYNTYPLFYEYQESLSIEEQQLDESNSSLEQQLEDDYKNRVKSTTASNEVAVDFKNWEYRTTGIKSFNFTCNKTLFNQSPGTSLNDYIYLYEIERSQIISYETNSLVFGYSDHLNKMSVNEWLSLKPMAQPTIYFRFKSIPEELSQGNINSLQFTFAIETTSDLSLEISTQYITLSN